MWIVEVGSKGVSVQLFVEPVLVVIVEVDVCLCDTVQCWPVSSLPSQEMESGHTVVKTRGPPDGRFTLTLHKAGDTPCACPQTTPWSTTHVKLYLDIERDQSHIPELASKVGSGI